MSECPCCSRTLLRHISQGRMYWFCTHCRQEMPNFAASVNSRKDNLSSIPGSRREEVASRA